MSARFVLAPQAALDLVEIWRYIKEQTSLTIADRVESAIREKIAFLAGTPGAGHSRKDLTDEDVRFFPVYSYLVGRVRNHCKSLPFFTDAVMWNGSSKAAYDRGWNDPLNWHTRVGHTLRERKREWREESDIPGSFSVWR